MNPLKTDNKRKPNPIATFYRFLILLSMGFTCLKLAIIGRLEPTTVALLLLVTVIIIALKSKILYTLLGIVSFYLFIKLYTQTPEEETAVIGSLIALGIVLFVIYRMAKRLFS